VSAFCKYIALHYGECIL